MCRLPHNSSKASSSISACLSSSLFSPLIASLLGEVVEVQGESCVYPDHCYTAIVAMSMGSTVISLCDSMLFFSVYLLDNHFLCSERNKVLSSIEALGKKIISSVMYQFPFSHRAFGRIEPG